MSEEEIEVTVAQSSSNEQRDDILEIQPDGSSFQPDITRKINRIITSCWQGGAYINWGTVPLEVRELWWNEFNLHFKYNEPQTAEIRRIFQKKVGEKIRNVVHNARRFDKKPWFVFDQNWAEMKKIFETSEYKSKCEKAKKSRATNSAASMGSVYCGGSINIQTHRRRLEKELGRQPTVFETFKRTYQNKHGNWSGPRAEIAAGKFQELSEINDRCDESNKRTSDELWITAVGGPKKGRIFGMGIEVRPYLINQEFYTGRISKKIALLEDTIMKNEEERKEEMKKMEEERKAEMKKKDEELFEERRKNHEEKLQSDAIIAQLLKGQAEMQAQMKRLMEVFDAGGFLCWTRKLTEVTEILERCFSGHNFLNLVN